ncbi:MAG: hypothetical protein ABSD64_14935 [Terriglobales bacterium]|jgi:hypothetical protein
MSTSTISLKATLCASFVLASLGMVLTSNAVAQTVAPDSTVKWTSVGPGNAGGWGGKVNAFAYVQSNPKIMYLGGGWGNTPRESPSQMGIYRTTNGGVKWIAANNGLTNPDGTTSSVVNSLWLDQKNPSVVLASTEFGGTFKSTNGGVTWHNVDRSEATRFAQAGSVLYLASSKGVLKSTNDGSTWTVSLSLTDGATTVVTAAGATYAGSGNGGVYQLNGSSWTKVGHAGTGAIHDLAVDPFNTKVVYASVDDASAWNQCPYASLDGGSTWTAVNCNLFSIGSQAIAFSNVTAHRLFVGDDGSGYVLYFTGDGNPNPTIHYGVTFNGADLRYVVPVPGESQNDDACYILQDQGLYYAPTCSSGMASALSVNVKDNLVYDVAVSPDGKNIEAPLQDNDSASSQDGGKTWPVSGPAGEGGEARYHPDNSGYCYVVHPDEGLYVSKDGCKTWSNNSTTGFESLTFDPADANTLYAVTGESSGRPIVSKSTNKGTTWSNAGWKFTNPYQVAVAPSDAQSILVATGTSSAPSELFYSHDGGTTWTQSTGLPTKQPLAEMWFPTHRFYAAFDSIDAKTVLLSDHDPQTDNVLIYRSSDGGESFTLVNTFVQPVGQRQWPHLLRPKNETNPQKDSFYYATRFYGNRVVFNSKPQSGNPAVVVTTRFGAFLSQDLGTTWTRIDTAAIAHHFVGATWAQGYLYLASFGQGIIRTTKPMQP